MKKQMCKVCEEELKLTEITTISGKKVWAYMCACNDMMHQKTPSEPEADRIATLEAELSKAKLEANVAWENSRTSRNIAEHETSRAKRYDSLARELIVYVAEAISFDGLLPDSMNKAREAVRRAKEAGL